MYLLVLPLESLLLFGISNIFLTKIFGIFIRFNDMLQNAFGDFFGRSIKIIMNWTFLKKWLSENFWQKFKKTLGRTQISPCAEISHNFWIISKSHKMGLSGELVGAKGWYDNTVLLVGPLFGPENYAFTWLPLSHSFLARKVDPWVWLR